MSMAESWSVKLTVGELDGETHAEARLIMDDDHLFGRGTARRNPADQNVTKIGEELAVARALSDLAHQLLHNAATNIENVTHEPARLRL
jgi:Rv2632c-like